MKWQHSVKELYYCLNAKDIILPFLYPVFWCDYVPAKPHPNLHRTSSLYYELFTAGNVGKIIHCYHFRPLWSSLYQMEGKSLICSETDVRKSNIACEYIIWIKYLLSNNVRKG